MKWSKSGETAIKSEDGRFSIAVVYTEGEALYEAWQGKKILARVAAARDDEQMRTHARRQCMKVCEAAAGG